MNNDLRRLSRKDLLEILVNQSKKIDELTKELEKANKKLEDKNISIKESGSLAEAALKLNNIFTDADNACKDYIDNIKTLNNKLEKKLAKLEVKKQTKKTKTSVKKSASSKTKSKAKSKR